MLQTRCYWLGAGTAVVGITELREDVRKTLSFILEGTALSPEYRTYRPKLLHQKPEVEGPAKPISVSPEARHRGQVWPLTDERLLLECPIQRAPSVSSRPRFFVC